MSSSSIEEELQYLREGLWRQFFISVELKSGGGFKLARSSTTVAENVEETRTETNMTMREEDLGQMEAMLKYCFLYPLNFSESRCSNSR